MQSSMNPFRMVGIILLTIGILDIGYMIYCFVKGLSYSSGFNIFAVVAGIFLIKGNLIAALITRFFVTFFVFAVCGIAILYFYLTPIDLIAVQIKLQTSTMLSAAVIFIFLAGVLIWICLQFSKEESVQACIDADYKSSVLKLISFSAAAAGMLLVGIIGLVFSLFSNGDSIKKAVQLAQEQFGNNYQYHVTSFNIENDHGVALVTAYNSETMQTIEVQW